MRARARKRLAAGAVLALTAMAVVVLAGPGAATSAPATARTVSAGGGHLVSLGKAIASPSGWQTSAATSNGIKLAGTYDDSGPAAWNPAQHRTVFITTVGPGYGGFMSKNTHPGVAIIDAKTKKIVAWRIFDIGFKTYFESHGLGVSPDGKWIYLPTGDLGTAGPEHGRLLVINAKTLRIHQIIQTKGFPHHAKTFTLPSGKQLVQVEDFNFSAPQYGMYGGSGVYILDPAQDNKVIADVDSAQLQAMPYLAFESPNGKYMSIGTSPGTIGGARGHVDGTWVIVDTKTWQPITSVPGGTDPVWTAFTPDNKTAYLCDAGSSEVFKLDLATMAEVGSANASVDGPYGCHLGWDPTQLWTIDKGEAGSNRGKNIGLVDTGLMKPLDEINTGCIRGDHGTVNPLSGTNELWVTCNSSFEVIVFNMATEKVTKRIPMPLGGSTHSGAFVQYKPNFAGMVLADQNGLHGPALARQKQAWAKAAAS